MSVQAAGVSFPKSFFSARRVSYTRVRVKTLCGQRGHCGCRVPVNKSERFTRC